MTPDTQRSDAERNRRLIIEAGLVLLARDPEMSVQQIADASGVGRTTFYRHFSNRDQLVEAVLEEVLERGRQATGRADIDPAEPEASLRSMTDAYLYVAFEFGVLIQRRDGASAAVEAAKETEESPTRRFLDEGRRLGTIRTDLPRAWQQTVMRTVTLTAIEGVEAGMLDRDEARRIVSDTLIAVLVADRTG